MGGGGGARGSRGEGKTAPFALPHTSLSGEKAKSQRQAAPGTPHPLSPVLKLSAAALGSLVPGPCLVATEEAGGFPLPPRPRARSRICPINKASA